MTQFSFTTVPSNVHNDLGNYLRLTSMIGRTLKMSDAISIINSHQLTVGICDIFYDIAKTVLESK